MRNLLYVFFRAVGCRHPVSGNSDLWYAGEPLAARMARVPLSEIAPGNNPDGVWACETVRAFLAGGGDLYTADTARRKDALSVLLSRLIDSRDNNLNHHRIGNVLFRGDPDEFLRGYVNASGGKPCWKVSDYGNGMVVTIDDLNASPGADPKSLTVAVKSHNEATRLVYVYLATPRAVPENVPLTVSDTRANLARGCPPYMHTIMTAHGPTEVPTLAMCAGYAAHQLTANGPHSSDLDVAIITHMVSGLAVAFGPAKQADIMVQHFAAVARDTGSRPFGTPPADDLKAKIRLAVDTMPSAWKL